MSFFKHFLEFFIPLFFTIDAFGLVPLFVGVTQEMTITQRRRVSFEAVTAAFVIAISFMLLGDRLFAFLGISTADFRIAGGIILLVLAIMDLLTRGKPAVIVTEIVGIVPLAMPLIAGPATLTTVLVLARRPGGYSMTALSLAVNFLILLLSLLGANHMSRVVGLNALRAFSKLVMVLLAAIAVNFIRMGVEEILKMPR